MCIFSLDAKLVFQPSVTLDLTYYSHLLGTVYVMFMHTACLRVGGCVSEWDTNERSDFSGKLRVIISSPRIKYRLESTPGPRDAGDN